MQETTFCKRMRRTKIKPGGASSAQCDTTEQEHSQEDLLMTTRANTYEKGSILLLAGTRQGLFLISSADRQHWQVEKTQLEARPARIFYAAFDARNHYRLFVADNGENAETYLRYSDDLGQSWREPKQSIQFPQKSGFTLKAIWYIEPGRNDEPGTMYAGTDPACLWVSRDYGEHWEVNEAMLMYPERNRWGSGLEGTCLHSIVADYADRERMWVSISGAGTLRSDDGGKSWRALNRMNEDGLHGGREVGTTSHRLLQHPTQPDILYQQSRNGVFKSLNGGESWQNIVSNLPSFFGFPLALDVHHPETLFAVVLDPDDRLTPGKQFTVYRTENAGENWTALTRGLPEARLKVLRHGLCTDLKDPCGIYVGTMSGELFASHDRGEHWQLITDQLPPIYAVTATEFV
jgi:photosystem II stability/assembly factor-like uncharacterized protein